MQKVKLASPSLLLSFDIKLSRKACLHKCHLTISVWDDAFMVGVWREIEVWSHVRPHQSEGSGMPSKTHGSGPQMRFVRQHPSRPHVLEKWAHVIPSEAVRVWVITWASTWFLYMTSVGAGEAVSSSVSHQITVIQVPGQLIFFKAIICPFIQYSIFFLKIVLIGSVSQFLNSLMSRFVGDRCTGVGVGQPVGVVPACS